MDKARYKAQKVEAGMVFINEIVMSDPGVPGGGVKDSGYGRECYKDGLLEISNRKGVVIGKL
jgi:succinate-semialdehyde dehydrogenase/glutarate-semialdehyde dehydrogenase